MKDVIVSSLVKATGLSHGEIDNLVEVPKDPALGDFAFPCFALARHFKKNPVEIAKELGEKIKIGGPIAKINVVGPYLNLFVDKRDFVEETLKNIKKKDFLRKAKGETIIMDYSHPNANPWTPSSTASATWRPGWTNSWSFPSRSTSKSKSSPWRPFSTRFSSS
jgi:arginyl-tRNA synthetase